jgi:hypothetical protein
MLIESEFTLNHLFTRSNASTILVWKFFGLGLFTIILVSSANDIGILLSFMVLGKSLTYIRNNSGPKTDPWGTLIATYINLYFDDNISIALSKAYTLWIL